MVLEITAAQKLLVIDGIKLLSSLKLSATFGAGETLDVKHAHRVRGFEYHVVGGNVLLARSARASLTPGR